MLVELFVHWICALHTRYPCVARATLIGIWFSSSSLSYTYPTVVEILNENSIGTTSIVRAITSTLLQRRSLNSEIDDHGPSDEDSSCHRVQAHLRQDTARLVVALDGLDDEDLELGVPRRV